MLNDQEKAYIMALFAGAKVKVWTEPAVEYRLRARLAQIEEHSAGPVSPLTAAIVEELLR